ncbi:ATP-dependent DNA helicase RecG [Nitrospira sp.]|nr:ATP-dependent DNA helicase RecG [Nitrospira sp.]
MCRQVVEALAAGPHALSVEVNLLALRTLFEGFEQTVDVEYRRGCLERARKLLRQLRDAAGFHPTSDRSGDRTITPPADQDASLWEQPIQYVKGVGPKRAAMLTRLGIGSLEDLLWTLPWRYEDRTRVTRTNQLTPGSRAMISGIVRGSRLKTIPRRRISILEVSVEDAAGAALAIFFNQPYLEEQLTIGTLILLSGRVATGSRGEMLPWKDPSSTTRPTPKLEVEEYEILHDEGEPLVHLGRLVPIYHETRGWSSRQMRALMSAVLASQGGRVMDVLPDGLRRRQKFPMLADALQAIHRPEAGPALDALNRAATPAHRRLAFEELFLLELALAHRHETVVRGTKPHRIEASPGMRHHLRALLPFQLTGAQERVIDEVVRDMTSTHPMNRLIQGDVGSGKTVVAVHALAIACASGLQAVLMAPTELLAEQHYQNVAPLCQQLGLTTLLLTGKERGALKGERVSRIADGTAQVIVGTHAVLQHSVRFAHLGLAVIDEQHKFGVLQRKMLVEKGYQPDVLIMTATPIPRTLAMTVYGDLDVSVIDVLPPGRRPVQTVAYPMSQRRKGYHLVVDELRAGRQAYIVYPLVEESEKVDLEAAEMAYRRLQQEELAPFRVGLVHGRLKAEERARIMTEFRAGHLDVLVATTVIEVGVDVPNATVMVIEHAERFGLAQLHQLRGRVGRGAQQSYCVLIDSSMKGQGAWSKEPGVPIPSQQRRDVLLRSTDGFVIAEEDLRIRGPGEMFGTRQSGLPEFRAANLIRDAALLEVARKEAFALYREDPGLTRAEHRALRETVQRRWQSKLVLGEIS